MAPRKSENRIKAEKIWLESGGVMKLKDIAAQLCVSDTQVRKWKSQDDWEAKLNGNVTDSNGNVTEKGKGNVTHRERKKRGAQPGNQNALNNCGGAPKGNQYARGKGEGKRGNKNAVTTGEYETIMWEFLDEEERELLSSITTDPLEQIDKKIRELTLRERRMMKRIKKIEDGLTDKQRRVLQERKKFKELVVTHDEVSGETKKVPVEKQELVVTEIEETEYRAIEDILHLEEALSRVTDKLLKAIKQKHDMLNVFEHKRAMDEEHLAIVKEKLALDRARIISDEDEETEDDGLMDLLNNASGVWSDYDDSE